jgi:hypothetical protein
VQPAPGARLAPQLFEAANDGALMPVTLMPAMLNFAVPMLVSFAVLAALCEQIFWLPNAMLVTDSETLGAGVAAQTSRLNTKQPIKRTEAASD